MNLTKQIKQYFSEPKRKENQFLKSLTTLKEVKEIGKGLANVNYLLSFADEKKLIIRFNFWKDEDWYTGDTISIKNEYQVLQFLERLAMTPKVYLVDVK